MTNIVVSPCSNPRMGLDEVLRAYADLGFRKFEVFTGDSGWYFTVERGAEYYLALGAQYGLTFTSVHLPRILPNDAASFAAAVKAAEFAQALGASVVIYKAADRPTYIQAAAPFLRAIDGLGVTPVLQNHYGTALSSLADYREVIDGIGDARMRTLLEVGHFHAAGVPWREGYALLRESIALIHIKDMRGQTPVPFGEGDVDLPGLFSLMKHTGYTGNFVVEMEVDCQNDTRTLQLLADARHYTEHLWEEAV